MMRYKSSQAGFTLIELAMALIIAGFLLTTALVLFKNYLLDAKTQTTLSRMRDIDAAITQYLNINGVLPCPAPLTLTPGQAGYGKSITDSVPQMPANDCYNKAGSTAGMLRTTGMTPVPVSPLNTTEAGKIVTGAVPVFSLGLPGHDIADAWGNVFTYAVTSTLTILSPTNEYNPTQGAIIIEDLAGNGVAPAGGVALASSINPAAQYVIVSYGADGAGAYTIEGVPNGISCPVAAPLERTNCNIGGNGGVFRVSRQISNQTGTANMFDDYVIYHALTGMTGLIPLHTVAPFEMPGGCPAKAGWQLYTGPAAVCAPATPNPNTGLSPYTCCEKMTNP